MVPPQFLGLLPFGFGRFRFGLAFGASSILASSRGLFFLFLGLLLQIRINQSLQVFRVFLGLRVVFRRKILIRQNHARDGRTVRLGLRRRYRLCARSRFSFRFVSRLGFRSFRRSRFGSNGLLLNLSSLFGHMFSSRLRVGWPALAPVPAQAA